MKRFWAVMSALVLLCFGAVSAYAESEYLVSDGAFVGGLNDIPAGWYSLAPADDAYTKISIFDCVSFEEPKLLASYAWWEDGTSALAETAEKYVVPLWDGCLLLAGYYGDLEYDKATGEAAWEQIDDVGNTLLTYVAPLAAGDAAISSGEAFEAAIGTYTAGESFPVGVYRITCSPNASWTTVTIYDAKEKLVQSQVMHFDEGGEMGRVEVKEGYGIKVDKGAALFEPSTGGLTPAKSSSASVEDPNLLYEDEKVSISFSDFFVEEVGESSYLQIELLIKNKTDEILDVTCDSIIVNGCAVHISKYVDVPANATFLNMWTNDAEQYLKYSIDVPERFSMVFSYSTDDWSINSGKIQSVEITIP